MKRYKIQDVKIGMNNGYGPFPGTVTVSINYDDGVGSKWLTGSECDGCIDFYLSDRDINGILSSSHMTDEDVEVVESAHIDELDGFELGNYDVVLENIEDNPDHPAARLVKYLVLLVVCQMDDFEGYAEMGKGRFIDEVDVPDIDDEFRGARDQDIPTHCIGNQTVFETSYCPHPLFSSLSESRSSWSPSSSSTYSISSFSREP